MVKKHYRVLIDIDVTMYEPSLDRVRKQLAGVHVLYPADPDSLSERALPTAAEIDALKELHAEVLKTPVVFDQLMRDEVILELLHLDVDSELVTSDPLRTLVPRLSPPARRWLEGSGGDESDFDLNVDPIYEALESEVVSVQVSEIPQPKNRLNLENM